jgi:hypothetical protein
MINDNEWTIISQKAFPKRSIKAPPFLATRVLAAIGAEETRLASTWWGQWRWMARLTIAASLLVGVGAFYLFQHAALPLDVALDGRSNQHEAIKMASAELKTPDDSGALILGLDS